MEPHIWPLKISVVDIVTLAPVEVYAIMVHLAGSDDPAVTEALLAATRKVLARTRVDPT